MPGLAADGAANFQAASAALWALRVDPAPIGARRRGGSTKRAGLSRKMSMIADTMRPCVIWEAILRHVASWGDRNPQAVQVNQPRQAVKHAAFNPEWPHKAVRKVLKKYA